MIDARHPRHGQTVPYELATVGDVMSRGVISCPPETPLRVVARLMATYGVAATRLDLDSLTAGGTAVTPLVSVDSEQSIANAGDLMAQYGIAHLAVTDPDSRRPVGVISTLDIARAVAADDPKGTE
jgi:CBS domain-containing protein